MLREISIGYNPVEDRLNLWLRSDAGQQGQQSHGVLLTRRLALQLLEGLCHMVRRSAQVPDTLQSSVRQALEVGYHHARLKETPVHQERKTNRPIGEPTPRLATRAQCGTRRSDRAAVVRFHFSEGSPLSITLGERTLHAFTATLEDRVRRASWLHPIAPPAMSQQDRGPTPATTLH